MKTSDKIHKEHKSHTERGLPEDSHFEIHFHDKTSRTEHDTSWTNMSEEREVKYLERTKTVRVSSHPIHRIKMTHGELSTEIEVPEGCEVYQSIKAETVFNQGGGKEDRILGRIVGIVKDGEVIEERYLDGRGNQVTGFKI